MVTNRYGIKWGGRDAMLSVKAIKLGTSALFKDSKTKYFGISYMAD